MWNPLLRKRAWDEVAARRNRASTFSEPLKKSPDMKDFLTTFYKSVYTPEKKSYYQQEQAKYLPLRNQFQVLVPGLVSYEDFWQRYEFRCDFDRVYRELQEADSQAMAASLEKMKEVVRNQTTPSKKPPPTPSKQPPPTPSKQPPPTPSKQPPPTSAPKPTTTTSIAPVSASVGGGTTPAPDSLTASLGKLKDALKVHTTPAKTTDSKPATKTATVTKKAVAPTPTKKAPATPITKKNALAPAVSTPNALERLKNALSGDPVSTDNKVKTHHQDWPAKKPKPTPKVQSSKPSQTKSTAPADTPSSPLDRIKNVFRPDKVEKKNTADAAAAAAAIEAANQAKAKNEQAKNMAGVVAVVVAVVAVVVAVCISSLSRNHLCSPIRPGAVLSPRNKNGSSSSPWWAPAPTKGWMHSHVCGEALVMTELRWESDNDRLSTSVVDSVNGKILWSSTGLISARFGGEAILVEKKQGNTKEVPAPWMN